MAMFLVLGENNPDSHGRMNLQEYLEGRSISYIDIRDVAGNFVNANHVFALFFQLSAAHPAL